MKCGGEVLSKWCFFVFYIFILFFLYCFVIVGLCVFNGVLVKRFEFNISVLKDMISLIREKWMLRKLCLWEFIEYG